MNIEYKVANSPDDVSWNSFRSHIWEMVDNSIDLFVSDSVLRSVWGIVNDFSSSSIQGSFRHNLNDILLEHTFKN